MPYALALTTRHALRAATLAALLAGPAWQAAAAPLADAPRPAQARTPAGAQADKAAAVLADLQAGRLQEAETALNSWPTATPNDVAQRQRLQRLVQQQRQRAARLLGRAEADLRQRRLPAAVERRTAAIALDKSVFFQPQAAAVQDATTRVLQARLAVLRCLQPRDAACMDRAVREARALAPHDPTVALLALQAASWWVPGQAQGPTAVEGTTGSR